MLFPDFNAGMRGMKKGFMSFSAFIDQNHILNLIMQIIFRAQSITGLNEVSDSTD